MDFKDLAVKLFEKFQEDVGEVSLLSVKVVFINGRLIINSLFSSYLRPCLIIAYAQV